jgi:hypothetical protein
MKQQDFAKAFNEMKDQLKAEFKGSTFELVRATTTHTAWRGDTHHGSFIVVRNNAGELRIAQPYDWFSE